MNSKQLREQRAQLWADAGKLLKAGITNESRASFDKMLADITVLDGDIARVEAVEQAEAEMRAAEKPARPNPGESLDPVENAENRNAKQKAAFRNYMLTGKAESRDLTAAAQGIAIPVAFNPQVVEAQKSYGMLYDMVTLVKTATGEPIKYVLDNDTGNSLAAVTSGTDAVETDPTLSGVTLSVDNYTTGLIKIDRALLQDAGFDIDAWVRDRFAKRFFRGASNLILAGDAGNVASFATSYTASSITSGTVAVLKYGDLATAIGTLDPAYQPDAVWACNNATLGYIVGMSDTAGRPLFIPYAEGAAAGYPGTILGRPVKIVTQMSNVATGNTAVYFGDFKQAYAFRQVDPGIGILRLDERYAPGFEVGFVGFARVGGISLNAGIAPVLGIKIQ